MQKASKRSSEGLFAEVAALFTEAIGVRIQLRTWVPHCGRLEISQHNVLDEASAFA